MADFPPPPVLTPPAGWLGFLGIKSGGRQPGVVAPGLAPTIDMDRFYRAGSRVPLAGPGGGVAAAQNGASTLFVVPSGKIWLVEGFNITSGVQGAAAGVIASAVVFSAPGGILFSGPASARSVTGETIMVHLNGPLIAMPGDQFSAFSLAAAAPTAFNYFGRVFGFEVSA